MSPQHSVPTTLRPLPRMREGPESPGPDPTQCPGEKHSLPRSYSYSGSHSSSGAFGIDLKIRVYLWRFCIGSPTQLPFRREVCASATPCPARRRRRRSRHDDSKRALLSVQSIAILAFVASTCGHTALLSMESMATLQGSSATKAGLRRPGSVGDAPRSRAKPLRRSAPRVWHEMQSKDGRTV